MRTLESKTHRYSSRDDHLMLCVSVSEMSVLSLHAYCTLMLKVVFLPSPIPQDCLERRFGLSRSQVRTFLHYQPSYYHLHVHFVHAQTEIPGIMVGKAHILQTVLYNMEHIDSDYYAKCMLSYHLPDTDPLLQRFRTCHRGGL